MIGSEKMRVLYEAKPPWIHVVVATISTITDFGWSLATDPSLRVAVRFLRGKKMLDLDALFNEFAAALQFPYYFGENWPAFDECINDLDWIPADAYILIITEAKELLSGEDVELPTFINVIQRAGDEWSQAIETSEDWKRPSIPFHVIFHCLDTDLDKLRTRLISAGASFDEFDLPEEN